MSAIVPVSKQDIAEKVPDISIKTIEFVLGKMVKENKVTKIGSYKDARYMRKNDRWDRMVNEVYQSEFAKGGNYTIWKRKQYIL